MKYVKIRDLIEHGQAWAKDHMGTGLAFGVGVETLDSDVDTLLNTCPWVELVQRFPTTVNSKYLAKSFAREEHTLQPVLLKFKGI